MRTDLVIAAPLWRIVLSAGAALLMLSLAALVAGCGGDSGPAPPPSEASAVIGAAGGTLDGPDGSRVEIPPGALSADTTITIARRDSGASDLTPDGYARGAVYEFTPHDIVFAQPVTLRIPAQANAQAADQSVFRAGLGKAWQSIAEGASNGFAQWQSASFSWYAFWDCVTSGSNPDPYPCSAPTGMTQVAATPAQALTLTSAYPQAAHRFFRVRETVTLQLTANYSAPADCGDARVVFKRRRAGDPAAVVLLDTVPTMIPHGSTRVNAQASHTVQLTDADNGSTILITDFSCRRAYQPPSRANLPPDRQRTGAYDVMVFDAQIAPAPRFAQHPADQSVTEGDTATFAAVVGGTPAPALQWQLSTDGGLNWTDVAGATGASHSTAPTALADDGQRYRLAATNSGGLTLSRVATLRVSPSAATAPKVTQQPADQAVAPGASATFVAAFSGTPAPALQWQRSTDGGASWLDVAGAQAASFTTAPAVPGDDGTRYRVLGSNASGSVASNPALLRVVVPLSTTPEGKLALGATHACAVKADYTVACWGLNNQGQLGNGSTSNASAPVAVSGLNRIVSVSVGSRSFGYRDNWGQSCAVQAGGGLWCWGRDTDAVDQLQPQAVPGATDARAVAVGSGHACYLDGVGMARCWGFNISGELGNGEFGNPRPTPAPVLLNGSPMGGNVAIGAGDQWSCALRSGGTVWCWGVDHTGNAEFNPQQIAGVSGATVLSVGAGHACAVVAGGAVRCWGFGRNGELGNGGTATSVSSVAVSGLTDATALAAGASVFGGPGHTCARRSGGDVVCWGAANLGNGSSSATVPGAAVTDLSGVTAVAAGTGASCALRSDGQVLCWGTNFYGQLGVGDTGERAVPTATAAGAVFWHP